MSELRTYEGRNKSKGAYLPTCLIHRLTIAASLPSANFPQDCLSALLDYLPIKAASFYSFDTRSKQLILRAQSGLSFSGYQSFELPLSSLAGQAITTGSKIKKKDLETAGGYRDRLLVTSYGLKSFLATPLSSSASANPLLDRHRPCVICIYPKDENDLDDLGDAFDGLSPIISQLYVQFLAATKLFLREQVVEQNELSPDLNSCLYRILQVLKRHLNVDAGSVFLHDEKSKLLRAHATTGLDTDVHKADVIYRKGDLSDTWTVFETGEAIEYYDLSSREMRGKYVETVPGKRKAFLAMPIRRMAKGKNQKQKRVGVLRLLNKCVELGGRRELVAFSWEDRELVGFFCDMLSSIVHQMRSRERKAEHFEKVMHGTTSNILAVLKNLDMLQRHAALDKYLPPGLDYAIPDSVAFLTEIKSQIDRLSHPHLDRLELRRVLLGGEVLAKIVSYIERLSSTDGIPSVSVTSLTEAGFFLLPPVSAHPDRLLTVFRNLAENAVKYSSLKDRACKVELWHKETTHFVEIYFADSGIGIPPDEADSIFEEGYRGDKAMRRRPSGTGFGLAQSRAIMFAMDGRLDYIPNPLKTIFKVSIPRWEKRA